MFAVVVLIYNIIAVSLEAHGDVSTNDIFPSKPSLEIFWIVITQGYWYLDYFWRQFENSLLARLEVGLPMPSLAAAARI